MADVNNRHDDAPPAPTGGPKIDRANTASSGTASAQTPAVDTRCPQHPGIVMRHGPTGSRAALADGPDVWEVIAALHALREEDPTRGGEVLRRDLRAVTGLTTAQVSAALDYYASQPANVDQRIADNQQAAERAQRPPTAGEQRGDDST